MKTVDDLAVRLDEAFDTIRAAATHFGVRMALHVGPLDNGQTVIVEFPVNGEELN